MTRKNFCSLPFTSLMTFNGGSVKPCCDSESLGDSRDMSLQGIWDGTLWRELRESVKRDERNLACMKCWDREDQGRVSGRSSGESKYHLIESWSKGTPKVGPKLISIRLGNKCNLKCIMCSPVNSSAWDSDLKLYKKHIDPEYTGEHFVEEKESHWTREITESVEVITFIGGEPFLFESHKKMVLSLVESGRANGITLKYFTNLTTLPSWCKEAWRYFKKIDLRISIDGVKDTYEYIRYPSQWQKIEKNMKELSTWSSPNLELSIVYVFMNINALDLENLFRWRNDFFQKPPEILPDFIEEPSFFSASTLDGETKKKVKLSLENILNNLIKYNSEGLLVRDMIYYSNRPIVQAALHNKKLYSYLLNIDQIRKLDSKKTFPHLNRGLSACNG